MPCYSSYGRNAAMGGTNIKCNNTMQWIYDQHINVFSFFLFFLFSSHYWFNNSRYYPVIFKIPVFSLKLGWDECPSPYVSIHTTKWCESQLSLLQCNTTHPCLPFLLVVTVGKHILWLDCINSHTKIKLRYI